MCVVSREFSKLNFCRVRTRTIGFFPHFFLPSINDILWIPGFKFINSKFDNLLCAKSRVYASRETSGDLLDLLSFSKRINIKMKIHKHPHWFYNHVKFRLCFLNIFNSPQLQNIALCVQTWILYPILNYRLTFIGKKLHFGYVKWIVNEKNRN